MKTVYVSIGNSDDKLPQAQWFGFWATTDAFVQLLARTVHGAWLSASNSQYQNAAWCFEIEGNWEGSDDEDDLRAALCRQAHRFGQDSITWAEVPVVEFLKPVS